ncbi:MAG: flagellar biosynthesis protein FlhA [Planctomycetota bacterium]|nr:flagellar biosynthesis protein FlhA [Planctomycetota bacterium]
MTRIPVSNPILDLGVRLSRWKHLLVPVAILFLLAVLVVPLPPVLLDVLIAVNISLAAVILLTTIYMERPLEFSVFPALLLGATLFRLVLNVASTRLILDADAPSPEGAMDVAGNVIEAFGTFVAGSSVIVGLVIFLILVIVQFVVITKGATRMSEVAARFTLDAMPGKQMAIDADLSSGLVDEDTARERRQDVTREADFYGAMDGASKFVRGDAIAALIITGVNIIGGIAIGMFIKGWAFGDTVSVFTKLTIGDGLASQVPAFIIAIAAGLIVARAGEKQTIGDEIPRQLVSQPIALLLVSVFLVGLAFTPLPTLPLLGAGIGLAVIGFGVHSYRQHEEAVQESVAREESAAAQQHAAPVESLLPMDALEIEIGFGLLQIVDAERGGDLLDRIDLLRRQLAIELGIIVPPVRIRDNMELDSDSYSVKLRGATVAVGTIYPSLLMAMDTTGMAEPIEGVTGKEPAFDLDVTWIDMEQRGSAEQAGYTVIDAPNVLATHLSELIRHHAADLLSREDVGRLLEQLRQTSPKLVDETVPSVVKPGELQKVMQLLLRETVPIRDLETILETVADRATGTADPVILAEHVRHALRRTISRQYAEMDSHGSMRLACITLDPDSEDLLEGYIDRTPTSTRLTMPPSLVAHFARCASRMAEPLTQAGHRIVVLASPGVRPQAWEVLESHMPGVVVLAYNEIDRGIEIESIGLLHVDHAGSSAGAA